MNMTENAKETIRAAWLNVRLEIDKSILMLSSAGIGLLVTILSFTKNINSIAIFSSIAASVFFIVAIFMVLKIFKKNSDALEELLSTGAVTEKTNEALKSLDLNAKFSFFVGILFLFMLLVTAIYKTNSQYQQDNQKSLIECQKINITIM